MQIIISTIITMNHLAHARTLAKTLLAYNVNAKLIVLLVDNTNNQPEHVKEPFEVITLKDLNDPVSIEDMCFYYSPFELCNGLRGYLHKFMMYEYLAEKWFYFDSDIMVTHSLETLWREIDSGSIYICPHFTSPVDPKWVKLHEIDILRLGLYNSGVVGLRNTGTTEKFIKWFKNRLQWHSFNDPHHGQFVDQLWLNFVPLFFEGVLLMHHPGANLAYWNLHERYLETVNGQIFVNGQPLLFIHFSGWDISEPGRLTKWNTMHDEEPNRIVSKLGRAYKDLLISNGYDACSKYSYGFSHFHSGEKITDTMRRIHYNDLISGRPRKGSPFSNYEYFNSREKERNLSIEG